MCVRWQVHRRLDVLAIDLECCAEALGHGLALLLLKGMELLLEHVQVGLRHGVHAESFLLMIMA